MNKKVKTALIIVLIVAVVAAVVGYLMLNKPTRKVAGEKGIAITAAVLVKEYQENENEANAKYLDKAIEVSGVVNDASKNQEGNSTIMLSSDDGMTGVFCTMKEAAGNVSIGSNVTIKGFCSGMLSDVRLRQAVLVK